MPQDSVVKQLSLIEPQLDGAPTSQKPLLQKVPDGQSSTVAQVQKPPLHVWPLGQEQWLLPVQEMLQICPVGQPAFEVQAAPLMLQVPVLPQVTPVQVLPMMVQQV